MDWTTGIDTTPLDTCTLQQARELISNNWNPVDDITDYALNHNTIRTQANETKEPIWKGKMDMATKKIIYWLKKQKLTISGKLNATNIDQIQLSNDFVADFDTNIITDGKNTYTNIALSRYDIQALLGRASPHIIYELSMNNDTVSLTVASTVKSIIKINIHKFKLDKIRGQVIAYVMSHPNKTIDRAQIESLNIQGFSPADRIDQIFINAFSTDIYKMFFECDVNSAKFIPKCTDIQLKKLNIEIPVIE